MRRLTRHLNDINLTYFGHMFRAWGFVYDAFKIIVILKVHAIFPFIWEDKATVMVEKLYIDMTATQ